MSDDEQPIETEDQELSEGEDENIVLSDHDSDTEEEADDSDVRAISKCTDFYIGKDGTTKWAKQTVSSSCKVKSKNIVKELIGPTGDARNVTSESSSLQLLIDSNIIEHIVHCTNLYIEQKRLTVHYARIRDARTTTKTEILALLGLLYFIGAKKGTHGSVEEFWDQESGFTIPRLAMSYRRFLFLLRCLRFDDKSTREDRKKIDKLAPIRLVLDSFVSNCKKTYNLGEFLTIDEKLEAFRGRCSFIQYIPNKPAKYGIKMFVLCDSKTFYTGNLEVYCGLQPEGPYRRENNPTSIVERLVHDMRGSNRNLTTDNWYTSYPLASKLLEEYKITTIGTIKKNKREIPPEFLPNKTKQTKSSLFGFQKNCTLVSYVPKKNKSVILISTMHDTADIDETTGKPTIILDYNSTKGGVDTIDQMCGTYSVKRTTRRWPLVIFFSIMDLAAINARILVKSNSENPTTLRRIFLKNLGLSLMKPFLEERANISSLPIDIRTGLAKYKKPTLVAEGGETNTKRKGRCVTCGRGKNINTTITCDNCGDFVCKAHAIIQTSCGKCNNPQEDLTHSD